MTFASLALSSLRERRLRSATLLVSVALACGLLTMSRAAVGKMAAVAQGNDMPALVVTAFNQSLIPRAYATRIGALPGIKGPIDWMRFVPVTDVDKRQLFVFSVSDGYPDTFTPAMYGVTPEVSASWRAAKTGAIVMRRLMERMQWQVGQRVVVVNGGNRIEVDIVGVADGFLNDAMIVHYAYMDISSAPDDRDQVGVVVVGTPHDEFAATTATLRAQFADTQTPALVIPLKTRRDYYLQAESLVPTIMQQVSLLLGGLTLAVLISMLYVSMSERRAEFGILRAMGYSRARVFSIVLFESSLLCTLGGVVGALVPYLIFRTHGISLGEQVLRDVAVSPAQCASAIVGAALFGLVAAILPALSVVRAEPLDLLGVRS